jgi:hypothetical protein
MKRALTIGVLLVFGSLAHAGEITVELLMDSAHPREVPAIERLLPRTATLQAAVRLSPPDDWYFVLYDNELEGFGTRAQFGIVREGRLLCSTSFGASDFTWGGMVSLVGYGDVGLPKSRLGIALAFANGATGAGSSFFLVRAQEEGCGILLRRRATQGRIEIRGNGFRLWDASYRGECNACPHRYKVTRYFWRRGKLLAIRAPFETKNAFDPKEVSGKPVVYALSAED